jgi:hypothetical protein
MIDTILTTPQTGGDRSGNSIYLNLHRHARTGADPVGGPQLLQRQRGTQKRLHGETGNPRNVPLFVVEKGNLGKREQRG